MQLRYETIEINKNPTQVDLAELNEKAMQGWRVIVKLSDVGDKIIFLLERRYE